MLATICVTSLTLFTEESPHHYFRSQDVSNGGAGTVISADTKAMQRARSSLFIWRLHDHAAYEVQATGDEYVADYFEIRRYVYAILLGLLLNNCL